MHKSPYTEYDKENAVEKSSVELVGYTKTGLLEPGAGETVTASFEKEQLKSYDANKAKTYILDEGNYYITAAADAHKAINNILAAKGYTVADGMTEDGNADFTAVYVQPKFEQRPMQPTLQPARKSRTSLMLHVVILPC